MEMIQEIGIEEEIRERIPDIDDLAEEVQQSIGDPCFMSEKE
jgi:hypothetical protein